jgi:hypothetical protein
MDKSKSREEAKRLKEEELIRKENEVLDKIQGVATSFKEVKIKKE